MSTDETYTRNGTWRLEFQRKAALEGQPGRWIVYLDTGITVDTLDPDSNEFRNEARVKFISALESDQFDLNAEFDGDI